MPKSSECLDQNDEKNVTDRGYRMTLIKMMKKCDGHGAPNDLDYNDEKRDRHGAPNELLDVQIEQTTTFSQMLKRS